jgi:hypothetical protein
MARYVEPKAVAPKYIMTILKLALVPVNCAKSSILFPGPAVQYVELLNAVLAVVVACSNDWFGSPQVGTGEATCEKLVLGLP